MTPLDEIAAERRAQAALVTIDDRAVTFTGEWPSIDALMAFQPWNKKPPTPTVAQETPDAP